MQLTAVDGLVGAALAGLDRLAAAEAGWFAEQARVLVQIAELSQQAEQTDPSRGPGGQVVERFVVLDLAGTLRVGQLAATHRLAEAQQLVTTLPGTLAALTDGRVLVPQARVLLHETSACLPRVAGEVEQRLLALDDVVLRGLTGSRLTRRVRALVLQVEAELDADAAVRRQQAARARRRVSVRLEPDGMASLWALLPAGQARVFAAGLDELVRRQRVADRACGLDRTADQCRADVLADLPAFVLHAQDGTLPAAATAGAAAPVAAAAPRPATALSGVVAPGGCGGGCGWGHSSVVVHVHVPVLTALGRSQAPGEVVGYGPISANQVRLLLPTAQLRRVLVDADTGEPLLTGGLSAFLCKGLTF